MTYNKTGTMSILSASLQLEGNEALHALSQCSIERSMRWPHEADAMPECKVHEGPGCVSRAVA